MTRPNLAEDIIPLGTFRARAAEMIRKMDEQGRPLVITQRGRSVAVVVTPGEFERTEREREVVRRLIVALEAAEDGDLVDDAAVWDEVDRVIDDAERARGER
jgi:antitoxin YefM